MTGMYKYSFKTYDMASTDTCLSLSGFFNFSYWTHNLTLTLLKSILTKSLCLITADGS
jgi:hypothetical protein